jgi:hypothetical protein
MEAKMQARLTTRPEQDVVAAIQTLDLETVKLRVMDIELGKGWNREYADSIELAYKNYLTMLVKYDAEDIMLSKDVDEFWHTHILHTMKYADDCQKMFGNFLHHNPQTRERSPADIENRAALAEKTRRLYQQEFGNAQAADIAWAGGIIKSAKTAYCDASVRPNKAAYCDAAVRADKAAYCDASVRPNKAAYCDAAARADKAAYCDASVRPNKAAYCDAAVRADKAAYCDASVQAAKAAYCDAGVRAENAT